MLLLVDGSNLLFQMFYGMPARILNERGSPIHGTLGFIGALLKIIRRVEPTHMAVLFDGECESERRMLDGDYKANRPDMSALPETETPFSQLPDIYAALDLMQIRHAETWNCECDDWLAGYALRYGPEMPVLIVSQDSDLFQLITDKVQVLRYRGEKTTICDKRYIQEKFGIMPEQYADFKALVGDSADNIRGVDKVGVKTAAQLLSQFGTLEQILRRSGEIAKPSIRRSIEQNGARARHNRRLIDLSAREELPFDLRQLAFQNRGWTTMEVLRAIGAR